MSYATTTDVQLYLPPGFTLDVSAGVPSLAQVTEFLTLTAAEIDAALASRGISVPVTAPTWFLAECQRLNAQGAAALVLGQIFPLMLSQSPASTGSGSIGIGAQLMSDYKKRLSEMRDGKGIPVAVASSESDLAPRGYLTDVGAWGQPNGTITDTAGNPVWGSPVFSREKVW